MTYVATRGREFLEWLRDPERQEATGGLGAFARWVVCAVEDGEIGEADLWYPKRMEARSAQFPFEDWKDARAMYNTREMRYCSGNGDELEEGEAGCWRSGSCSGVCSSGSRSSGRSCGGEATAGGPSGSETATRC